MQNKFADQGNLHYGEVHAFSDLFASYETSQWVQSRENLVRLDLFTRVWAV